MLTRYFTEECGSLNLSVSAVEWKDYFTTIVVAISYLSCCLNLINHLIFTILRQLLITSPPSLPVTHALIAASDKTKNIELAIRNINPKRSVNILMNKKLPPDLKKIYIDPGGF